MNNSSINIKRQLKILMFADFPVNQEDAFRGGVKQTVYMLTEELAKFKEIKIKVLTTSGYFRKGGVVSKSNYEIKILPSYKYDSIFLYNKLNLDFQNEIERFDPNIIHAQGGVNFINLTLKSRKKNVVTFHGLFRNELPNNKSKYTFRERVVHNFVKIIEKENFKKAQNVIAISDEIENLARKYAKDPNIYRINNMIDYNFFNVNSLPNVSMPGILFIGWLSYRKGIDLLLQAYRELHSKLKPTKLVLIGSDEQEPNFVRDIKNINRDLIDKRNIVFLGKVSQKVLIAEIEKASIVCLPSRAESAPMVISQALAAGRPVVASNVGGIPQMVQNGINGYLFQSGNGNELTKILLDLFQNSREKIIEMAKNAKKIALRDYHPHSIIEKTINTYFDILSR